LFLGLAVLLMRVSSYEFGCDRFRFGYSHREDCHKAANFLTKHYGTRRVKIILNGRKVGNGDIAVYFANRAYFAKRRLTRRTVLHELYNHLVYVNGSDMPKRTEEKAANRSARDFLRQYSVSREKSVKRL
jgi:hypothetical protein